jgi:hypothetical protein
MATKELATTVCVSFVYRTLRDMELENLTGFSCFDNTDRHEYQRYSSYSLEKIESKV